MPEEKRAHLHSQRIFLTGASGFLGARVSEMLIARGHKLALLLRHPETAWRVKHILSSVDVIKGDLATVSSYEEALRSFEPDILIHMAWSGVAGSDRNADTQKKNIPESTELLKVAHESGVKHFVGLGSQAEYGPLNRKLDETAPTKPTTLYGESKLAVCETTRMLCEEAGIRFSWLRLFSAYGPRDNPNWLIPSLILKLAAGEKLKLTPGEQLWDFIYIDDAAKAIIAVAETLEATGIFNLGSGTAPPLHKTIKQLRDLINLQGELGFGEIAYRPDQVMHLEADIARITAKTGWRPETDLARGLKQTIAWFTSHAATNKQERHAANQ